MIFVMRADNATSILKWFIFIYNKYVLSVQLFIIIFVDAKIKKYSFSFLKTKNDQNRGVAVLVFCLPSSNFSIEKDCKCFRLARTHTHVYMFKKYAFGLYGIILVNAFFRWSWFMCLLNEFMSLWVNEPQLFFIQK